MRQYTPNPIEMNIYYLKIIIYKLIIYIKLGDSEQWE